MTECYIVFTTTKYRFSWLHILQVQISRVICCCKYAKGHTNTPAIILLVSSENWYFEHVALVNISDYYCGILKFSVLIKTICKSYACYSWFAYLILYTKVSLNLLSCIEAGTQRKCDFFVEFVGDCWRYDKFICTKLKIYSIS